MVVPEHNFVIGPLRTLASSNQSENVAAVKHLCNTNSTVDVSHELALEGYCIKNAEAELSPNGEAILLLVKADVQNILFCLIGSYHFRK